MVLKDVNGKNHPITKSNISWMLVAGWLFYLASCVLNIIFYMIHPSFADISGPAVIRRLTDGEEEGLGDIQGISSTSTSSVSEIEKLENISPIAEMMPLVQLDTTQTEQTPTPAPRVPRQRRGSC